MLPGSDRWRYGDTQLGQLRPDCLAGVRDDGRLAWREGDQTFPAGLVIYWAWNNSLSVVQQSYIMRKHGTKIELIDNIKAMFAKKKPQG